MERAVFALGLWPLGVGIEQPQTATWASRVFVASTVSLKVILSYLIEFSPQ